MSNRFTKLAIAFAAAMLLPVSGASAKDYAGTALNIIPSGQYGSVPPPTSLDPGKLPADQQAQMYDGLTPLFDNVSDGDLTKYFKSEALNSLGTDGPGTPEEVPGHPEIQITRDIYNVPHVVAQTHEGGVFAAGWIAAEDRGLLLNQARYNARVAAIGAPGLSAIGLVTQLKSFVPSAQTEAEVAKQTQALEAEGKEGKAVLADIDTYIGGINAYNAIHSPSTAPFTRNDIYALNALKGQFLGQGGGDEARRTQFLSGMEDRLGKKKGMSVFNDLRQFKNDGVPTTVDGRFPYGKIPKQAKGNVLIDHDSYVQTPAVKDRQLARSVAPQPTQASNTLMISKGESTNGRPLMVGGPQIGYFYPGLTYEIDMDAPGLIWRGATSAPFPGYLLIGRGEDFATTLTSASADIIDQYAEKLCGGSDTMYKYKGKCREMGTFDAGTLDGDPVVFNTTVHGSVTGYATVNGKKVAIASKRSSYGEDVLDLLYNRRLSNGQVHDPKSFFKAASKTPQTFNSFYIDNKHVAEYTAGKLPIRPDGVDPGLLTNGNGKYEWKGFLSKKGHPQGTDPKDGTMTNWNQVAALGFGSADDQWGRAGSAERVDLLNKNLDRLKNKKGKWSLASVTAAMNAAATQDVRAIDTVPLLKRVLKGSKAPSARAQQMLDLMVAWRKDGGNRLDLDNDGKIDNPGAAVMDGSWNNIADAFMKPRLGTQLDELATLFSRFDLPPSGQYSGWYQYFDRDINALLGRKVPTPFANAYCGKGKLKACQTALWNAIDESGAEIAAAQGTEDPAAWRSDATREQIKFSPINLRTMRYTNRPSGIQQVISFNGHRPNKKK
ncbi:MAG: penicillin acylase family protein [Thermoleophilales bacterium]|nr:penicillin acylase family protein [Thermoleophilales bacterium]